MHISTDPPERVPALLLAEELPPDEAFARNVRNEQSIAPPELKVAWGVLESAYGYTSDLQRERNFAEATQRFAEFMAGRDRYAYQAETVIGSLALFRTRLDRAPYTPEIFGRVYKNLAQTLVAISLEVSARAAEGKEDTNLVGQQYECLLLTLDAREGKDPGFVSSAREETSVIAGVKYGHDSYRLLASDSPRGRKLPIQSRSRQGKGAAPDVCRVYVKAMMSQIAVEVFGPEAFDARIMEKREGRRNRVQLPPEGRIRLLSMTSQAFLCEANGGQITAQEKTYLDAVQTRYAEHLQKFASERLGIPPQTEQ